MDDLQELFRLSVGAPRGEPLPAEAGRRASAPVARTRSPVEITAAILRGRFTALILWDLFWGSKRFYRILRDLGGINRKALVAELTELERRGLVERRRRRPGPGPTVYALTATGESLKLVLGAMYEWGLLAMAVGLPEALDVQERLGSPRDEHSRARAAPPPAGPDGPATA